MDGLFSLVKMLFGIDVEPDDGLTPEFWDWSWEEMALYDLEAMLTYITSKTNSKVFVVGHSQFTPDSCQGCCKGGSRSWDLPHSFHVYDKIRRWMEMSSSSSLYTASTRCSLPSSDMMLLNKVCVSHCYQPSVHMFSRYHHSLNQTISLRHNKHTLQVLCSSHKKDIPIVDARSMDDIYDTLAQRLVPTAASGTNTSLTKHYTSIKYMSWSLLPTYLIMVRKQPMRIKILLEFAFSRTGGDFSIVNIHGSTINTFILPRT